MYISTLVGYYLAVVSSLHYCSVAFCQQHKGNALSSAFHSVLCSFSTVHMCTYAHACPLVGYSLLGSVPGDRSGSSSVRELNGPT